ncbi:MAG: hypothetical protein ACYTFG_05530 [Planctomycetota bacterium]|jgi:hypothetical protein
MSSRTIQRLIFCLFACMADPAFTGEEAEPPPAPEEALRERIAGLVARLGSESWKEREEASKELAAIGEAAVPALQKALESGDPEVAGRAEECLRQIRRLRGEDWFEGRFGGRRNLRAYGGGRHTESAVLMGLIWLKNHQSPDGTWSCDLFMKNCKKGTCAGGGESSEYDTGVTGLALLSFLGAGHTHKTGKFKDTVKRGLKALKGLQTADGCFGPKTADGHWIYNHAVATQCMAEAYALADHSPLLQAPAQKAVTFLSDCQNPYLGWRYGRRPGDNDTSCTAWSALALRVAKAAGLKVPVKCFDGSLNFLVKVTNEETYETQYVSGVKPKKVPGKPNPYAPTTAAALTARVFLIGPGAESRRETMGHAEVLKMSVPKWDVKGGTIDMVHWYWGTLGMFQMGRQYWKCWNEPMKNALVPTQQRQGCVNGSWDPVGAWGKAGGRVFATAVNVQSLQVYYRYKRILGVK